MLGYSVCHRTWNYSDLILAAGLSRQQGGFGLGLNNPELRCHLSVKASVSGVFAMHRLGLSRHVIHTAGHALSHETISPGHGDQPGLGIVSYTEHSKQSQLLSVPRYFETAQPWSKLPQETR